MRTKIEAKNSSHSRKAESPFFSNGNRSSFFQQSNLQNMQFQQKNEVEEPVQAQLEEEEEPIQTIHQESAVQFQVEEEEEMVQPKSEQGINRDNIHRVARKGFLGNPVSYPFFSRIQEFFGNHNISGIQAYGGSGSESANRQLGSLAFAAGNKVAFRGTPNLHTAAHEAAHVVQQKKGVNLKSGIGKKGDVYEQHADAVAELVVNGKSAESLLSKSPTGNSGSYSDSLQFTVSSASVDLGQFWDMHVNPGTHPGENAGNRGFGRQVRSFQRLHGRSTHQEGGQRIVDINDRGLTATSNLNDSEQIEAPSADGPREWDITLVTHELFDPSPQLADVMQGAIGDCYLLATLQAMAARPGGRIQLTNAVNEVESGYSVEFFRPRIVGGQALVDPNSKIRVSIGRGYNPRGVQLRETSENMSDADARQLLINNGYGGQLQEGDNITVWWTKRIVWPWAIERAYASVAGGYGRIEGGYSALPIMVLTGEVAHHIFNFTTLSEAQLASALNALAGLVDSDSIITAATYANLNTIYSNLFFVQSADDTNGLRISGVDGVRTGWIPWDHVYDYIADFIIMDPFGYSEGRPLFSTKSDFSDWQQALIDASARSGVMISGRFTTLCLGQGLILVPAHEYSVTAVSSSGAQSSNPWAVLHPGLVRPAQLKRAFSRLTFKA